MVRFLQEEILGVEDSTHLSPVLTLPEGSDGFVVYCDASRVGLGFLCPHTER